MIFRSLFRSDRLNPEWTYSVDGVLWRLLCAKGGRIVGECRDQERKTASFFCIDESTGLPLWENLQLEEAWWVGIEAVLGDTLILHSYAKPDMPQHRGIRAFDVASGLPLWRNDESTYWFGAPGRLYAYRDLFERRVGYELELKSGEILRTFDDSLQELNMLRGQASENQDREGVVLPEPFDREASVEEIRSLFAKELRGERPTGNVDFLQEKDVVAFSYHLTAANNRSGRPVFENRLSVFRTPGGARLFSEIINANLSAPFPDAFFVRSSRLLFLKNQRSLVSLRLWQS